MKTTFAFLFVCMALVFAGCGPQKSSNTSAASSTANDTWRLDKMAQQNPEGADFAHVVESFYQAIEKQDWPVSYDLRTAEFKHDVTRDLYLKTMAEDGKSLHLNRYEVLKLTMFRGLAGGDIAAEMIMRFDEGGSIEYGSSRWKKQDGVWLCDDPGLGVSFLQNTRMPAWITN